MLSAMFLLAVYVTTATAQKFMSPPNMLWRPSVVAPSFRPWQVPNPVSSVPWQIPFPRSEPPTPLWYPPQTRGPPTHTMVNFPSERGTPAIMMVSLLFIIIIINFLLIVYLDFGSVCSPSSSSLVEVIVY